MTAYRKWWFSNGVECTEGIILSEEDLDLLAERMGPYGSFVTEIAKLFPVYEAPKMLHLKASRSYDTWEAAFAEEKTP